jgi:single-strand DNA-binding protein
MEILVGRVVKDAKIATLKEEKKVVNFSIAINDSYKAKGSTEVKKFVTYVNCSYWISTGIAEHLKKGTLVELCGRISVSAWNNMKGEALGSLNFHVINIKLHGKANAQEGNPKQGAQPVTANSIEEPALATDDLPF